jgi:hypothetical protein
LKEWVRTNLKPIPDRFRADAKYQMKAKAKAKAEATRAPAQTLTSTSTSYCPGQAGWCESEGSGSGVRYRREAVARFEAAMERKQVTADSRATITYLIGELYRRVGDPDKAKAWFARVPDAVGGNAKQEWLIDLAIQQSTNPKEMVDEERGT